MKCMHMLVKSRRMNYLQKLWFINRTLEILERSVKFVNDSDEK